MTRPPLSSADPDAVQSPIPLDGGLPASAARRSCRRPWRTGGRPGRSPAMTDHTAAALAGLDADSAEWPRALAGTGPRREEALARLHGLLVRIAQREVRRRGPRLRITGPELDDLAHQAAADALVAIT